MVSPPTINILSLCSGGGGLDDGAHLALDGASSTVCYVEREAFVAAHLASRMAAGQLDPAPVWADLRTFDGHPWRGAVDLVTAGFPCQPWSCAGQRRGVRDERDLWPDAARIVGQVAPGSVFIENVAAEPIWRALQDLARLGYRCAGGPFSASEVGASHHRERWFGLGVAHPNREQPQWTVWRGIPTAARRRDRSDDGRGPLADSDRRGLEGQPQPDQLAQAGQQPPRRDDADRCRPLFPPGPGADEEWADVLQRWPDLAPATEPPVRGVVDGVATNRRRWLAMLGNGVVPLQAAAAFVALWATVGVER